MGQKKGKPTIIPRPVVVIPGLGVEFLAARLPARQVKAEAAHKGFIGKGALVFQIPAPNPVQEKLIGLAAAVAIPLCAAEVVGTHPVIKLMSFSCGSHEPEYNDQKHASLGFALIWSA